MPESIRRQIGKYQIQAELGRGGFGVVYRAYDPTVGRPVAVKVLTALGDNQLLTRFKNEAAAAGNLRHKNIVTIYDYGDDNGLPYIVMELLEGEDLNQVIASRRPLALLQKVSIMMQVADGLWSAHRAGVVHRDVKPGNIRLLPDGTVKLMDFGIARLVAGSAGTRLTRQGHLIGTLSYMAPEQVLGDEVDALSDIFAYGSTYYELLTGNHPFRALDPRSVFHKITAEDPEPIRNLVPDCPEPLEKIVSRTLQKDRDLRYQSLRDVQVDTEPILFELRQERAQSLVAEAKRLYGAADLEGSQTVLSEVFDLDPANREARRLRETIQAQLLDRLIRPKVDALVKKADEALAARRYEEAIETIEAALRLDRSSRLLAEKLEEARRLLALRREISGLMAEARRQFSRQDLDGTLEMLSQVVERDPSDPDAQQFLAEVRVALTRREKERDYQDRIQRAGELLEAKSFDEAMTVIEELDPEFKNREELRGLATQIRSSREKFERQQLLTREIAAVRDLLAATQFESAIKKLEQLMKSFPEEVEPTKLFIVAHKQLAAYRKTQALDKLEKELSRLVENGYFERALSLIAQSLKTYPAEPRLLNAQRQIEEDWAHSKRETAICQALENAERLVTEGNPDTAVEILEASWDQYPDEPRLLRSLGSARDALASKRREEGILGAIRQAQSHLDQRRYADALAVVDGGATEYGADRRLSGIREKISDARAAWERAEAIREILDNSGQLAAQHDFPGAVGLLQAGIDRFPNEPALTKSLATTQAAFIAKKRQEAIERLCADALARGREHRFDEALGAIDDGIAEHGTDRRLTEVRDQVVAAKATWERSEDIRRVLAESQQSLAQGEFERAIGAVESGLKRYPGDVPLTDELKTARNALAAKRRDEAIEALCQKVQGQTDKRDFGNAVKAVDRGLADYGRDPRLVQAREAIVVARAAWERAQEISRAVDSAQQRLSKGQPESAMEIVESALKRYGDDPRLLEARTSAQQALAEKRRNQAIDALRPRVQKELDAGEYGNALGLVEHGLEQYGNDLRLTELRERTLAAKAAWERAESVRQTLRRAQEFIGRGEFDGATSTLDAALTQFPNEQILQEALASARKGAEAKRRDDAIEALIRETDAQVDQCDFPRAFNTLHSGIAEFGDDRRFTDTRARITLAKSNWEHAEAVRSALEDSKASLAYGEPNAAVDRLDKALKQFPAERQLIEARETARKALAALRREQAIHALLTEATELLNAGEFGNAISALGRGLSKYGFDDRLSDLRKDALKAKSDWERAQLLERVLNKCRELMRTHQPEDALATLESTGHQFEGEPRFEEATRVAREAIAAKKQREEAIQTACRSAQGLADRHEYERAFKVLGEAATALGEDFRLTNIRDQVAAAQAKWEYAQVIRASISESQKRIAENDPQAALVLLEETLTRFPNDPDLLKARAHAEAEVAARRREAAIAALSTQTQLYINTKDFPTALAKLEEGLKTYGPEARLAQLRERVLAAQAERERTDALQSLVSEANNLIEQHQPENACSLLEQALNAFPGAPSLIEALHSARKALESKRRDEFIEETCAQALADLNRGNFDAALRHLDAGLNASPDDRRLHELRDRVVSAQAKAQRVSEDIRAVVATAEKLNEQGQREEAIAILERALNEYPANSDLVAATVRIIDAVGTAGTDAIDDICRDAREYALRGNFDLAFHSLERALQLQEDGQPPAEQKAETATRSETARALSGSAQVRDKSPAASVKEATEEQVLPNITKETGWIPTEHESSTYGTLAASSNVTEERKVSATLVEPTNKRRAPRNHWIIAVGAALLLVILFIIIRSLLTTQTPTLQVRASPRGAIVRVNDRQCSTPACEFKLAPGQYRIQVSAEGYQDKVTTVTLRKGETPPVMIVALEPLSPILRLSSNFADGEVMLDKHRAGRLQEGQFLFEKLSLGRHTLRVASPEGTATMSFNTEAAKQPTIDNVSQQNTDAIGATSFGRRASFTCADCTGSVTIDDHQVGDIKANTITVDDIAPGTHKVKVGDELSLVFTAGSTPTVNLVVNSNRNFGSLVIDASADNATVYIDGKKYPKLISKGPLFIQADAKEHVVKVAKNGYRSDPPEMKLQLAKGDQLRAHFNLIPEPARLVVTQQMPDSEVFVDGVRIGVVAANGSFAAEIPAGNHEIEFRKDNYTAAQVRRSFEPGQKLALTGAEARLIAKAAPITPPSASPPPPKPDPNAAEQAAWQSTQGTQSITQLEAFLNKYPSGLHKDEAQARLKELRAQQAAAVREAAWNAVDKNSRASIQEFLSTYGDGSHAQDARSLMNTLDAQNQEERSARARAAETARRTAAITSTLAQFEDAFNRRDLASLQSIWTDMPKSTVEGYRNQFRDARTLEYHLKPDGPFAVTENAATATCTRTIRFVAKNGVRPPEVSEKVRVGLERVGDHWVIRTITKF